MANFKSCCKIIIIIIIIIIKGCVYIFYAVFGFYISVGHVPCTPSRMKKTFFSEMYSSSNGFAFEKCDEWLNWILVDFVCN